MLLAPHTPRTRKPARWLPVFSLLALALVLPACHSGSESGPTAAPQTQETAWTVAGKVQLAKRKGDEHPGLHNVFALSRNIVSGSEPHGQEGLASVAKLGVKTIISVDGQVPDAETARGLGLRYVHLPIQYKSIAAEDWLALAKTFRECEPPFYVHCFHGQHRGPAAAAVGRRVLDQAPAEQVVAEMRQWMGTGEAYAGLYETVMRTELPGVAASRACTFSFPCATQAEGIAEHMTHIARAHDALKQLSGHAWTADAAHPDLDAGNEARKLEQHFNASWNEEGQPPTQALLALQADARLAAAALSKALGRHNTAEAGAAFQRMESTCRDCHAQFRNL